MERSCYGIPTSTAVQTAFHPEKSFQKLQGQSYSSHTNQVLHGRFSWKTPLNVRKYVKERQNAKIHQVEIAPKHHLPPSHTVVNESVEN